MTNQKKDNSRKRLITLCKKGIVPVGNWEDSDSHKAQEQLGVCWVLLNAGCEFKITQETNNEINLLIHYPVFGNIEVGRNSHFFYIPTEQKLSKRAGIDWY